MEKVSTFRDARHWHWQVLIMAALAFLPLIPLSVSNRAYRFTFFGTAIGGLHSIYLRCGVGDLFLLLDKAACSTSHPVSGACVHGVGTY